LFSKIIIQVFRNTNLTNGATNKPNPIEFQPPNNCNHNSKQVSGGGGGQNGKSFQVRTTLLGNKESFTLNTISSKHKRILGIKSSSQQRGWVVAKGRNTISQQKASLVDFGTS